MQAAWSIALLAMVALLPARAAADTPGRATPSSNASRSIRLPNGLTVVTSPDHRIPVVAVDICYGVGSANDPAESPGLGDAVGWLLRNGPTRHLGLGEAARLARAAKIAWTRKVDVRPDETHIAVVVPSNALEFALWMEAERMGFLADAVDAYSTELAADSSFKEWMVQRQASPDDPGDIVQRVVVGPAHPYFISNTRIKVSAEGLRARLRSLYTPGNAAIAILGDVSSADSRQLVEKYFGAIPGVREPDLPYVNPAPWTRDLRVAVGTGRRAIIVAWPTAASGEPDDLALDVAAHWLKSHLKSRLVDHDRLAEKIIAGQASNRLGSGFIISATLSSAPAGYEERAIKSILEAFEDALEQLRTERVDAGELNGATRLALLQAAEGYDGLAARARMASAAARFKNAVDSFEEVARAYQAIDGARLAAAVRRNLGPDQRVIVRVEPTGRTALPQAPGGEPNRTFQLPVRTPAPRPEDGRQWLRPPRIGTGQLFSPPDLITQRAATGARVLVSSRHDLPIVRFEVSLPWFEKPSGLDSLLPQVVSKLLVNGEPLDERLAALGVQSKFSGSADGLTAAVEATSDAVEDALRNILSAIRVPKLTTEPIEQAKNKRLEALSVARQGSARLHLLVGEKILPAAFHGHLGPERETEIGRADRGALERYLAKLGSSERMSIIFVGDIGPEEALRAVDRAAPVAKPVLAVGAPARREKPLVKGVHFVEETKNDQVGITFVCPFNRDDSSQLAGAQALTWYLLRAPGEDLKPLETPQAGTRLNRDGAYLFWSLVVQGDSGTAIVRAMLGSLNSLATGAVTASWIGEMRQDILQHVIGEYDSTRGETEFVGSAARLGQDRNDITAALASFGRLDSSAIRAAARRCLEPATLRVVGYGRREAADELKSRGYGPVEISNAMVRHP